MTTKQIKQLLMAGTLLSGVLAVGVLAWALTTPIQMPEPKSLLPTSASNTNPGATDTEINPIPTLQELAVIGRAPLRQPLKPEIVVKVEPKLTAVLQGTSLEPSKPEQSMAFIKLAGGNSKWFFIGESFIDPIGEVTIKSIADQKIVIEYRGAEHDMEVIRN